MKKIISIIAVALSLTSASPVKSQPEVKSGTLDSMGCMIERECTEGVFEIKSYQDILDYYQVKSLPGDSSETIKEFNELVYSSNKSGVKVFISDNRYFPPLNRGVYHTVSNNFYLNSTYVYQTHILLSVMRHEGWHAAQDCMAGTIDNGLIALIKPEEDVPQMWRDMVERTYPESAWPWESEASWAGRTEGMTLDALNACAEGEMWNNPKYPPTPLTREWLVKNGYLK